MNVTWALPPLIVAGVGAATAVVAGRALADLLGVARGTGIAGAAVLFFVALWLVSRG